MDADSSDLEPSDRNSPSTLNDEDETGMGDADSIAKRFLDKARGALVKYMEPNPIFDCALESEFFKSYEIRDMKEKENTSEKNRSLCEKIRPKGRMGYENLKDWLRRTDQKELVEILERIEVGKEYATLLEILEQKIKNEIEKGSQKDEAHGKMKSELPDRGLHGKRGIGAYFSKLLGSGKKDLQKDLQNDLISFYNQQHKYIPLSPLLEEDQPLLKFYEMPDIQSVKVTRSRDGDTLRKTKVRTLRDVFYKENKLCSNIYLSADAGYGKTAFSKKLALAWCQSKKPDKSEKKFFSKDEIAVMGGFRFVFLVLLRNSLSECDIDDLVLNQILSRLAHKYSEEYLAAILCDETCLVILDGLDEWTHPLNPCMQGESNVPHQRVRENVAVLTTTRPWKLNVCGLHSSQTDQKFELEGLSDESTKKLKKSVISQLCGEEDKGKIDEYEMEFSKTVEDSHKSDLTTIPLFLMYFLFLWKDKRNFGKSLADLYSSFIELLLSRTVRKEKNTILKSEKVQGNIPPCFKHNKRCEQFFTLLTTLGKLAFHTYFCERKENTLVFDGCVAEEHLRKDELTFCLKTGILTQSRFQGDVSLQQKTKLSFAHKTMQEFLAALYIIFSSDQKSVHEIVLSKCKCITDILEMSKLFMFIVSINAELSFSRELMKIINEDEITHEYRKSLQGLDMYSTHPLKDIQDVYISCCKEIPLGNETDLCLQDVFINTSCKEEEYRENLKQLAIINKQNIRSLYVIMLHMKNDTPYKTGRIVIDYFALNDLENIEKIYYTGDYSDDVILPLLNSSVKSLLLSCNSNWSRSLFDKVRRLNKLEAIGISRFEISHSEFSLLLDFISQTDCLREIELEEISCTDHGLSCAGLSIDLSPHSSLRKVTLSGLKLSKITINMKSLDYCTLKGEVPVLKFVNCDGNYLTTFHCQDLNSSAAIDEILSMLHQSRHIRHIELEGINIGRRTLTSPQIFVNIERLQLYKITMEASTLAELVESVLKLKQTVTVDIWKCTISPKSEFERNGKSIASCQDTGGQWELVCF